jgi:hypothetical protein
LLAGVAPAIALGEVEIERRPAARETEARIRQYRLLRKRVDPARDRLDLAEAPNAPPMPSDQLSGVG